jgi:hypothetical protein
MHEKTTSAHRVTTRFILTDFFPMSTNEYVHDAAIVAIKNQGDKENMVTTIANTKYIILTQG